MCCCDVGWHYCLSDHLIWPSIQKFGLAFLWTKEWDAPNDIYGALVPIYGTLVTSFIALLIAVPVSFGIALFLTELALWLAEAPAGYRH